MFIKEGPWIRLHFTRTQYMRALMIHRIDTDPIMYRNRTPEEDRADWDERNEKVMRRNEPDPWTPDVWEAIFLEHIFKPAHAKEIIDELIHGVDFEPMWRKQDTEPTIEDAIQEIQQGNVVGGFYCASNIIFRECEGRPQAEIKRALFEWMEKHFPETFVLTLDFSECDLSFLPDRELFSYFRPEFLGLWKAQLSFIKNLKRTAGTWKSEEYFDIGQKLMKATDSGAITWTAEETGSSGDQERKFMSSRLPFMFFPQYPTVQYVTLDSCVGEAFDENERPVIAESIEALFLNEALERSPYDHYSTIKVFEGDMSGGLIEAIVEKFPALAKDWNEEEKEAASPSEES